MIRHPERIAVDVRPPLPQPPAERRSPWLAVVMIIVAMAATLMLAFGAY